MKQVLQDKGGGGIGGGISAEVWERRFEHDGTKLLRFPLPQERPTGFASKLDDLAQRLRDQTLGRLIHGWSREWTSPNASLKAAVTKGEQESIAVRERMIALQEELDWDCYRLYGLIDEALTYGGEPPRIRSGARAFERVFGK